MASYSETFLDKIKIDCYAKGPYPAFQGVIQGMAHEAYTLPKQHTPSFRLNLTHKNFQTCYNLVQRQASGRGYGG